MFRVRKEEDEFFFVNHGKKVATLEQALNNLFMKVNKEDFVVFTEGLEQVQFDDRFGVVAAIYSKSTLFQINNEWVSIKDVTHLTDEMSPFFIVVDYDQEAE